MVEQTLGERDIWKGIRNLKKEYTPTPYSRKTKSGEHVTMNRIAEQAGRYLAEEQWGKNQDSSWKEIPRYKIVNDENKVNFNTGPVTLGSFRR